MRVTALVHLDNGFESENGNKNALSIISLVSKNDSIQFTAS